jgi:short-subunit dehydrogenase
MSTTNEAAMDKVLVITGASAGIGAELAKQLGARGAKVVLAARCKPELDAVAKAIGDGALAVVTDVTKRGDVEHPAKAAIATHPGIHVTLLLPEVVATEFGLNSLGVGIVDNRKLPGAQPVEGAAKAIVDVIENPRPEAYTSPFIADVIARYLHEPEAVEAEIAARPR